MQKKTTTTNRRKLHRRQAVVYYRESTDGDDSDSVAAQKEIIGRWAAETSHEIVEEVIDRWTDATPSTATLNLEIEQHVTKHGDLVYVFRMDANLWRRWRRGDMSLRFDKLSKYPGDRAVFVTTDKEIASILPWLIYLGTGIPAVHTATASARLPLAEAGGSELCRPAIAPRDYPRVGAGDGRYGD